MVFLLAGLTGPESADLPTPCLCRNIACILSCNAASTACYWRHNMHLPQRSIGLSEEHVGYHTAGSPVSGLVQGMQIAR